MGKFTSGWDNIDSQQIAHHGTKAGDRDLQLFYLKTFIDIQV
jgi:hypothetical protein